MKSYISAHALLFGIIMMVCLAFGIIGFSFFFFRKTMPRIEKCSFRIVEQEVLMHERVSKILIIDDRIALFYENEGYVAFYSEDGAFSYGILVDTSDRGTGNIAYLDGKLVIKSKANTIYIFDGAAPVNIYSITSDNLDEYRALEKRMGDYKSSICESEDTVYSVSGDHVEKTDSLGNTTIVLSLPKKDMNPIYLLSFFFGLALLLIMLRNGAK